MYVDWGPPHLSLVVCYIFHLLIPLLCKTWFYKDCNRSWKNFVLDVIGTLGSSNQAIYYNLLNIYFSSLINLDILVIMSPKIDASYLWILPLDLVPTGYYRSLWTVCTFRSLYCIYQLLQKKTFYCSDHRIKEFGIIDSKNSSTAYVILYELIDTWFLDWNRRVGVWSLPWRWHILSIPLTTSRGTGAETCGLDDVFPPDDLCSHPEALF